MTPRVEALGGCVPGRRADEWRGRHLGQETASEVCPQGGDVWKGLSASRWPFPALWSPRVRAHPLRASPGTGC